MFVIFFIVQIEISVETLTECETNQIKRNMIMNIRLSKKQNHFKEKKKLNSDHFPLKKKYDEN